MARLKTIKEKRVKRSFDIPEDISEKINKIAEKEDRSFTYITNYLLKKAIDMDCEKCRNQSGDK